VIEKTLEKSKRPQKVGQAYVQTGAHLGVGCPTKKSVIEVLVEGQKCPFCHFAELKREGNEIVCPICGYGHKVCT
jgi:ribosomal protein L37AE/L43A